MNYALIKEGIVENVFVCNNDETAEALFPDDTVMSIGNNAVGIGWHYVDSAFTAPLASELSQEEIVAAAEIEKASRLDVAKSAIVIWQTKLLMGRKLLESESALLNGWMDYIDAVTDIDTFRAPDIDWPVQPDS